MKKLLVSLAFVIAAPAFLAAGADLKTEVQNAAKKLADQPNYSWTTTSKSEGSGANFRMGPIEGKTEKAGCACFSGSFGETKFEVALKGEKFAVKQDDEWKSSADLENERMARRIKSFKVPAAEATDLARTAKELKKTDGVLAGDLTEEGVKEVFGRWSRAEAAGAKGSVKFWLKEGALVKFEYNVQGTIKVGQDQNEMEINRTTTVEVKDVGKTKLELPAEVKKMLQ